MFKNSDEWDDGGDGNSVFQQLFSEGVVSNSASLQLQHKSTSVNKCSGVNTESDKCLKIVQDNTANKLTREQWKRKQRNKRKCKNKFKENELTQASTAGTSHAVTDTNIAHVDDSDFKKIRNKKGRKTERINKKRQKLQLLLSKEQPAQKDDLNSNQTSSLITNNYEKSVSVHKVAEDKNSLISNGDKQKEIPPLPLCGTKELHSGDTVLESKLNKKLHASRFRYINEQLYTCDSIEAKKLFDSDPEAFGIYHGGYTSQVEKWPIKPLELIIKWVKSRSPKLAIADFGCGEAFLAQNVKNKVYSFDLVALNQHVTVADIAKVPLDDESVDIAVFCLSLMGTNINDFIAEANRVLKIKGVLKIAEVASRFENHKRFVDGVKKFGFRLLKQNVTNSHFYLFDFVKIKCSSKTVLSKNAAGLKLKACLYKKR